MTNSSWSNISDEESKEAGLMRDSWKFVVAINLAMMLLCLWSILAFVNYGRRSGKWKRGRRNQHQLALLSLAVATPTMTLVRLALTLTVTGVGLSEVGSDAACNAGMSSAVISFVAAALPAYLFLWTRQRTLYAQPALKRLNTARIRGASAAALCLMLVGGILSAALFIEPRKYHHTSVGCAKAPRDPPSSPIRYYVTALTQITSQLLLLALFVHPLRMHGGGGGKEATAKKSSGTRSAAVKERLRRASRLATCSTVTCAISDLVAMAIASFALPRRAPSHVSLTVYDVSLTVNVAAIALSFDHSKQIFLRAFRSSFQLHLSSTTRRRRSEFEMTSQATTAVSQYASSSKQLSSP